jgi:tetratricopeptide (TPR) repeat protein
MSKTGRNDPCPCGSGKKFKHCCFQLGAAPAASRHAQAKPVPAAIAVAQEHLNAGRLPQAEAFYRQILDVEPDHPDALHSLGVIAYQVGNNDVAAGLIGRAANISPSGAKFSNLGLVLQAQGKPDAAVASYRKALLYQPDHAEAHNNLGNALADLGNLDESIAHYRRALLLKPDFAVAHNNLGNALADLGNLDESIAHYRRALLLKPDFAVAHNNLCRALNLFKRLEDMLASAGNAVDIQIGHAEVHRIRDLGLSPQSPDSTNKMISRVLLDGIKYHQAGNLPRAEICYQFARQIMRCVPDALHLLGMIAHEMGRTELALDLIGRAIDINSSEPLYLNNLELVRTECRERGADGPDCAAAPGIEIISATRMTESEFWNKSALGVSLRSFAQDSRLVANIAFENRRGLPEVFNERINDPEYHEILVFIHDDVWIDDFFFADRLIHGLDTYDVIGVAGNQRRVQGQPGWGHISYANGKLEGEDYGNLCGSIAHGNKPFGVISGFGAAITAQCELMDGVFMAARKSKLLAAKVQFDPRFDFHFYDMDFCRSARTNGLRLGTWPIHLTHQSEGAFLSAGWENMYRVYLEKWKS